MYNLFAQLDNKTFTTIIDERSKSDLIKLFQNDVYNIINEEAETGYRKFEQDLENLNNTIGSLLNDELDPTMNPEKFNRAYEEMINFRIVYNDRYGEPLYYNIPKKFKNIYNLLDYINGKTLLYDISPAANKYLNKLYEKDNKINL